MKRVKISAILCISFVCFSCARWPSAPSPESDLSEEKGTLLTSSVPTNWLTLIWSKTGNEIITAGASGINAVNVSTQAIRQIEPRGNVYQIQLSKDGNRIYYLLGPALWGGPEPLYKTSLDGKDRRLLLSGAWTAPFSLSSDSLIAHPGASGTSMFLYNESDSSDTFLADGYPITFSPDGKQLLYRTDSSLYSYSRASGAIQRISLPADFFFINKIRWDENGIRVLWRGNGLRSLYITNITTNETMKLLEYQPGVIPSNSYSVWSPDGGKIAYWSSQCVKSGGLLSCEISRLSLHVINISEKREILIAYANNVPEASIAFSPDGNRISYVLGDQIFAHGIP